MKQQLKHDCTSCVPLGPYIDGTGNYDLVFCPQTGKPIVLERGTRLTSEPVNDVAYQVALRRAEKLGVTA